MGVGEVGVGVGWGGERERGGAASVGSVVVRVVASGRGGVSWRGRRRSDGWRANHVPSYRKKVVAGASL